MPSNLELLNNQASSAFDRIKEKTIWRSVSSLVLNNKPIDKNKIEQALKAVSDSLNDNEDRVVELIDETTNNKTKTILNFLDTLNIDNELKVAISYIIASGDKDKRLNLQRAKGHLERELDKL